MNTCDKYRDLILTDYIDHQLDKNWEEILQKHILECEGCREFALSVRKSVVEPLQNTERKPVGEHVWLSIKSKIQEERIIEKESRVDRLKEVFAVFRPAPVIATFVSMILIGSLVIRNQELKQVKEQEQSEYLVQLLASDFPSEEPSENSVQTPIEQYFL